MPNPPLVPSCVYRRPHELLDEIRRNRGRFRRRTKPYLHSVLCHCAQPWVPERDFGAWRPRAFWMRAHALALLDTLAPLAPALVGTLAADWNDPHEWRPTDRYVEAIELTLAAPDWGRAARALGDLGYRVERLAAGVEGERDFFVTVRRARVGDAGLDAAGLRAAMADHYPPSIVALYASG